MKIKTFHFISFIILVVLVVSGFSSAFSFFDESAQVQERRIDSKQAGANPLELYLPLIFYNPPFSSMFGIEMEKIRDDLGLGEMVEAKATWVRRNGLRWSRIEETKGVYNWAVASDLEKELVNANRSGMETVLVIRSTPEWAQEYPGIACGPMKASEFQAFANFMKAVVQRYSVHPYGVEYFEIWNEPDAPKSPSNPDNIYGCWYDPNDVKFGGEHYGKMLKVVYPAVKTNPDVKLLVGGLLLDCNPNNPPPGKDCEPAKFLERILSVGGGKYFDGVSYHAYDYYFDGNQFGEYSNSKWHSSSYTTGPAITAKANYLKNLLHSYGFYNKFLINSEEALICYGDDGTKEYCKDDDFQESKAIYVTQSYVKAYVSGLRSNIWYAVLGWSNSGLFGNNMIPYPAYYAYSFTSRMLGEMKSWHELSLGSGLWAYEFELPGRHVWVVWSQDGNQHTINLSEVPNAAWEWDRVSNAYESALIATSYSVGVAPIFLEWVP
ncbi:MAG: hypothetical protein U9R58_03825 [Chloroflexota bacterium]|nr:hypothetical protein [Chloroflexota bacterium]